MIFTFEKQVYMRRNGRRCRNIRKHILSVLRLPSYLTVCYERFHYTYPMFVKLPYKRLFRLYDDVCRVHPSNLCRIEQGRYSVGIDVLCKILSVLHADLKLDVMNYLFNYGS